MSAYPSLLSPLMDATGLIATAALNTLAQTALAAGTYASAEVDVLKITALQEDAGIYTGLAGANMVIDGSIECTTLKYTTLDPPVSGGGWVGTATSILDMSDYAIQNTPSVGFKNGIFTGIVSMTPSGKLDFETMGITNITDINCDSVIATGDITTTGNIITPTLRLINPDGDLEANITVVTANNQMAVDFEGSGISNVANLYCSRVFATAEMTCTTVNAVAPQFKPTYDYYVSKGGSDSGLGSVLSPFLTVQHAITLCETFVDGVPRVVHLSSGTFTENLTFTKSRISIVGEGTSMNPDVGSCIAGTVTINLASGNSDLNNNNIYFSGLLINGYTSDFTFGIVHRVFFTDCYLYSSDYVLFTHVANTLNYRVFVDRCTISNSSTTATNPLITFNGAGMISITNSKITSKGGVQIAISLTENVKVDTFANNIITSDSTATNAQPILVIDTAQTVSIASCGFIYSNSAVKSNSVNNCSGIFMNANSGSLYLIQCFFSLLGLYAPNHCVKNSGPGICYFANNISPSPALASTIDGTLGTNKIAMIGIN
jgi:hypothetical protein